MFLNVIETITFSPALTVVLSAVSERFAVTVA